MDGSAPHRPRPVADAPISALADGTAVAKAWLLTLVADVPLSRAAAVPAGDLARGGPALCAAILAALVSDDELDRLGTGGDRSALASCAGRFAGARDVVATAQAVEALRRAASATLRTHLGDAPPSLVADLGDRLAHVCSVVSAASLSLPPIDPPGRAGPLADVLTAERRAPVVPPPPPAPPVPEPVAAPAGFEGEEHDLPGWGEAATVTPLPTAGPLMAPAGPEAPWRSAIARRLERRAADGLPFGVLVAEVDDLERLLAAQAGREVAIALEGAERALTAELAPADVVVRERLGRWWLTSPDRDTMATRELGARIAAAIARATAAGVPLEPSVGMAVCPDDGADVDTLVARAEQGLFTARAAGLRLA